MPQAVSGNYKFTFSTSEILTNGTGTGALAGGVTSNLSFANGAGAGNIQASWSKSSTPAASTPDNWTLSALTDDLGRAIAFTKVRVFVILNTHATTSLIVGLAATHPWAAPFGATGSRTIPPGGMLVITDPTAAGMPVTSGSSDQLKIDPGGTAGSYQIALAGE